jgi:hypothetical protein
VERPLYFTGTPAWHNPLPRLQLPPHNLSPEIPLKPKNLKNPYVCDKLQAGDNEAMHKHGVHPSWSNKAYE